MTGRRRPTIVPLPAARARVWRTVRWWTPLPALTVLGGPRWIDGQCGECWGEGGERLYLGHGDWDSFTCPVCHGTGNWQR